jgi:NADH dehydrogenase FAD-containing subunit
MVRTKDRNFAYDYLVIATGATMRPEEVPGLGEYAQTIFTPEAMLQLRPALERVVDTARAGRQQRVLFLVPPNNKCSGPLYEMVMMLDTWLRRKSVRKNVFLTWTTYEDGYIQAFGPRLNGVVEHEFMTRDISGHTGYVVEEIGPSSVRYQGGHDLPYDLLIAFPPYVASTRYQELPADDRGFIATELGSRQVKGHPEIYAAGDAGDFPVKQAFLAFLQADAVAEHLAAQVRGTGGAAAPFKPTSMCVMEEFNTATFAQVPLRLTGLAEHPLEVHPDGDAYLVGTSPIWRVGKKMLGMYLPWRFNAGRPFHAGLPWKGMELGLKAMSSVLATSAKEV